MDRRNFMKMCSVAGLGVVGASMTDHNLVSAAPVAANKLFLLVNFGGGLDMTVLTDPKGETINSEGYAVNDPLTSFGVANIRTVGSNLTYPDIPNFPSNRNFFELEGIGNYTTIIRGIDQQTNGHDTGQRNTWSGRLAQNSPAFGALYAAATGAKLPMAFITNGGYDSTFGVPVSKTRLGDAQALYPLIYPNQINPQPNNTDPSYYHTPETFKRILATRQARLDTMQAKQNLPLLKRAMSLLYTSRLGMEELKQIDDYLQLIEGQDPSGNGLGQGLARQGKVALAAFKAGLTVSATISTGGFDTHGQSDQNAIPRAAGVMDALVEIWHTALDLLDMQDELVMVVGSDFSRTPRYNENAGRDHWAVNSMMIVDPSGQIPGGRVIGATDDTLRPTPLNIDSLTPDPAGVVVQQGHVHKWLREVSGIEDNDVVKLFPTNVEEFIQFTG
jgi:hypothetical protein